MDPAFLFALILGLISLLMISSVVSADLAALFGLMVITVLGFIEPSEAFSGFASGTVITMVAMFFVAEALRSTGITEAVAVGICRWVGRRQVVVVLVVMLLGALISAGMSNIAAVSVTLPAVMLIAQRTDITPAKLLMPLTFAVVLGGTMTTIGSTTNLVMIDIMQAHNIKPFEFLSFTPFGALLTVAGILFTALIGVHLLPIRKSAWRKNRSSADFTRLYSLAERTFSLRIPRNSLLSGLSLQQARFGTVFGAQVLAIRRRNQKILYPPPNTILYAEDVLIVQGRKERVEALLLFAGIAVSSLDEVAQTEISGLAGCALSITDSRLLNQSLADLHFRERYDLCVIAIKRADELIVAHLATQIVKAGDVLYIVGKSTSIDRLKIDSGFSVSASSPSEVLSEKLFMARLPATSHLFGLSLKSARIGELAGVQVLALVRAGELILISDGSELLESEDSLVLIGDPEEVSRLGMLGSLQLESADISYPRELSDMAMAELVLAPRSKAIDKTLVEIDFREKYDFQVLGIWHKGRPRRSNLASIKLQFGDALLVHGPREKLTVLKDAQDFVFLSADDLPPFHLFKASVAILTFIFITFASVSGLLPVHVAAVIGALFVVLSGALKMEEAYRQVNWAIVFIVAALIPFGIAFTRSGLVEVITEFLIGTLNQHSFWTTVIVISLFTSLLSQVIDGIVALLLISPIAIQLATKLDGDPRLILMAVALSASIAFITPFSHKANLLVMGAGGYRPADYARLGVPLTIVSFLAMWAGLYVFAVL